MNFSTFYFDIKVNSIIKALVFHLICLVLVMIGIFLQLKTTDAKTIGDIDIVWVVILCSLPVSLILIAETENYTKEDLPKGSSPYFRPHCKLREYSFVLTLATFYRHASVLKSIIIYVLGFFCSTMLIIEVIKYPQIPYLWFMGAFFIFMVFRYKNIRARLQTTKIITSDQGLSLPYFSLLRKYMIIIPWNMIVHLDIIGSERNLIAIAPEQCVTIEDNISFIRGIIITYKCNGIFQRCVITDTLLSSKMLWGLYNCCLNYVQQKEDRFRIAYRKSPVKLYWEDEVPPSILFFARYRLSAADNIVRKNMKKRYAGDTL